MTPITILQCFHFYLPHTMNWAFRLIHGHAGLKTQIGAPWIVQNQYYDPTFEYVWPFYQWKFSKNEWEVTPFQKKLSRLLRKIYWKLIIRSTKTNLIHAHFAPVACEVMYAAQQRNIPLIVSFYGNDYEKLPYLFPKFIALYRDLFQIAAGFCCEGHHGAEVLQKMGCPPHKIHVIRLGLEPTQIKKPLNIKKNNELRLVQAATFTEKKGIEYSVQAFGEALKTCPNMHLTLIGEKGDKALVTRILQYINLHNLSEKITILDFVEHDRFHDFLSQFHVFIHPSTYAADRDCEGGGPVVLLDAQRVGLPVIATTHCDIPDYVSHGISGILVAERDVKALSAAIKEFYEMEDSAYQIFSENARSHVQINFDIRESKAKLAQLYQNIASSCGS